MGSNNNKNQSAGPSISTGSSFGNDPRGIAQNQIQQQSQRYNAQQGPAVDAFAYNYGRGSEADYGNYTDIMNQYRNIADSGGSGGGGGGFDASGMFTPFTVSPGRASYNDPFASYKGYQEFSNTGGYSPEDIANMRARSVSPIRAAYANAERNVNQQRSLQGGYAPNAIAAQIKMARDQGQSMADASTNTEAQLAQMKQAGRLSGLGGMAGIEGQRLNADVDLSKFNTNLDYQGQTYNAGAYTDAQMRNIQAAQQAAAAGAASAQASTANRLAALGGMRTLYGTTPGMSQLFGDQLMAGINSGSAFGTNMVNSTINSQKLPGQFDQTMGRIGDVSKLVSSAAYPALDYFGNRGSQTQQRAAPYQPQYQPQYNPQYQPQYDPYYADQSNPGYDPNYDPSYDPNTGQSYDWGS